MEGTRIAERKVIAPMLVESGSEHPKNVTHSDIESALMLERIRTECAKQRIDGVVRVYFTLKAVPLQNGRFFLLDGITGGIGSFMLGLVNVKLPFLKDIVSGSLEPDSVRNLLKTNVDAFLDYDTRESLVFHGVIDSSFKKGIQDWAVHATYDTMIGSLFIPDVISAENPLNLLKTLSGLENAFESQIDSCVEISSVLKQSLTKIESRILDRISSINLSPAMEDQKKKLLDRIRTLGAERDQAISLAEEKVRDVKNSLGSRLRSQLERAEELGQKLRAAEALVKQFEGEHASVIQSLRTEESRQEAIEDQILEMTRHLREIELKKAASSMDRDELKSSDYSNLGSDINPQTSEPKTTDTTSSSGSKQIQVEKLELKEAEGDLLQEKIRQNDRTIEELSLEITKLNFMLPQVRSRVNQQRSLFNRSEAKLKAAKQELERAQNELNRATKKKIQATEQEATLIFAMKDDIVRVSSEYQTKIEAVLKQVSLIEISLKEEEHQFVTLKKDIAKKIETLVERLQQLEKENMEVKKKLFDDSIIVLPALETEPLDILFPIYIVFSREETQVELKRRFKIFFPAYVSKLSKRNERDVLIRKNVNNRVLRSLLATSIGNRIIGKLLSLSGSSTLSFKEPDGFKVVEDKFRELLENDVDLSSWIMSILPTTDLLTQSDFFDRVNSGLQKLQSDGTLSKAEVAELRSWALEIAAI